MKSLFQNKFLLFAVIAGVLVFALVVGTMLALTASTKAAVLNDDITSGTTITESMVKEIDVPQATPGDFAKTKEAIIGQKAASNIKADQLIYASSLMTAIDSVASENDEFIVTSLFLPDERALGGLLVAGDTVDISIVPDSSYTSELSKLLPDYDIKSGVSGGIYFILANVKLLDTTTSVSSEQGSNLSAVTDADSSSGSGSYYLVSLSYNDYKKLRIAEQFGDIWLTMTPTQNETYAPMLEDMAAEVEGGLSDSAADPITVAKKRDAKKSSSSTTKSSSTSSSSDDSDDEDEDDNDSSNDQDEDESSDNNENSSSSSSSSATS